MSNTITPQEYRQMMEDRKHGVPKNRNPPPPPPRKEKSEPSGKLTVEEAVRQIILMLDMDESQIKKAEYVINQLRINGKL